VRSREDGMEEKEVVEYCLKLIVREMLEMRRER
jgi:hypothetical protein